MNTKNKVVDVILHGEAMIFPSRLPKSAKAIKTSTPSYHIIADSETTGNHHVVDCFDGVSFFEDEGTTYMVAEKPTQVRCVHENRHSAIPIAPGTYEFGIQQEYDHLNQHLRNIKD